MLGLILTLGIVAQTDDLDYMLLPPEPPRAKTPVMAKMVRPRHSKEQQTVPKPYKNWYRINQPDWLATEWVWGVMNKDGKVDWEPSEQEAAWERVGKRMPVWSATDAYGQNYVHYDRRVLQKFLDQQKKRWESELAQPRSYVAPMSPVIPGPAMPPLTAPLIQGYTCPTSSGGT